MARKRFVAWVAVCSILALPAFASAAEKGHEGMHGDHGGGHAGTAGKPGGHDMAKMGDKVFSGKIGPWKGEARLMDMKAHMAGSGVKAAGPMPNSHHLALTVTDPKAKAAVAEGKGTVRVTGPDKKESKSEFMVMQGHFGADVNLPKPGKYTFKTEIESGGKKGGATFSYTLK